MINPFHLAFPIKDIEETKRFYENVLGCEIGRESDAWVDFNFFGHQLSAHLKPDELTNTKKNKVDGKSVPVRHFGVVLGWEDWHSLSKKLQGLKKPILQQKLPLDQLNYESLPQVLALLSLVF